MQNVSTPAQHMLSVQMKVSTEVTRTMLRLQTFVKILLNCGIHDSDQARQVSIQQLRRSSTCHAQVPSFHDYSGLPRSGIEQ